MFERYLNPTLTQEMESTVIAAKLIGYNIMNQNMGLYMELGDNKSVSIRFLNFIQAQKMSVAVYDYPECIYREEDVDTVEEQIKVIAKIRELL